VFPPDFVSLHMKQDKPFLTLRAYEQRVYVACCPYDEVGIDVHSMGGFLHMQHVHAGTLHMDIYECLDFQSKLAGLGSTSLTPRSAAVRSDTYLATCEQALTHGRTHACGAVIAPTARSA
jgi:hypothetical protein